MAEHSHEPYRGDFPEVRDEAANSPRWLPALGFALLLLFSLVLVYRTAFGAAETEAAETEAAAAPAAEGEAH